MGLFGSAGGGAATAAAGQEFELNGRRLRVVRQLGEGGYSFVYLVREVDMAGGGGLLPTGTQVYALKRVSAGLPACPPAPLLGLRGSQHCPGTGS
jgi:serine/threonine protein kinase